MCQDYLAPHDTALLELVVLLVRDSSLFSRPIFFSPYFFPYVIYLVLTRFSFSLVLLILLTHLLRKP